MAWRRLLEVFLRLAPTSHMVLELRVVEFRALGETVVLDDSIYEVLVPWGPRKHPRADRYWVSLIIAPRTDDALNQSCALRVTRVEEVVDAQSYTECQNYAVEVCQLDRWGGA